MNQSTLLNITWLLALTLLLVGCDQGVNSSGQGDALERIVSTKKLVIAYADEEPYGYLDPSANRVTGEAPEIARVVAGKLGVETIEPVLTEWRSLIPGLKAGRFDCIAAGMYITPQRAENVIFSDPTYRIGEAFLVKAGNPRKLVSYQAVAEDEQARFGYVRGTAERDYALALNVPESRMVSFPDPASAVAGLRSGQIDVYAGTELTLQTLMRRFGDDAGIELAADFQQPVIDGEPAVGYGAFAFRPEDVALRDAFNEVLRDFLGSEAHRELVAPFGFLDAQMPQGKTAQQVLDEARQRIASRNATDP